MIVGMRKTKNVEENLSVSEQGPLAGGLHTELLKYRWDRKATPRPN
jgi:hypothetical protein